MSDDETVVPEQPTEPAPEVVPEPEPVVADAGALLYRDNATTPGHRN